MTEEALRKEWPAKSFDDIARAHNVDPKKVADALKAQRIADLDKAVADKRLSATAAERLKSHLDTRDPDDDAARRLQAWFGTGHSHRARSSNRLSDVLVVDDDRKTVDLVRLYLERAGFGVRVAYDGRQALELVRQQRPDLVVLDLMLPRLDGLDVCHILQQGPRPVPVIMLTARTTEEDKLFGLETGADDYVTKPFSPRELVARVKVVLRRAGSDQEAEREPESRIGKLVVDHLRHEARLAGTLVHLTPKEFRLLQVLAREPGRAFERHQLLERAFGYDYDGLERTVDVHVAKLRKKIEPDPTRPIYVLTVPGVGYKLASAIRHPEEERRRIPRLGCNAGSFAGSG